MAHSCLQAIKKNYPDSKITVMARSNLLDLAKFMPEISNIIKYPFEKKSLNLRKLIRAVLDVRKEKFDIVINTQNTIKSAIIPFLSGIKTRTGWLGENRYILLNDYRLKKDYKTKLIFKYYQLLAYRKNFETTEDLLPVLEVSKQFKEIVKHKFLLKQLHNNIITISPFSAQYSKDWPIENYSSLIPRLQENGYEIWLLSSPRDHSKLEELNKQLKVKCKLFPNTSIFDVISLISFCNTMICGDSGLLHAASALNKKVIGLYGPTNPEFSPPLTKVKCVLKGSCNSKNISLISDIKINDVYQAVIKLQ